jgi:sulfate transport system substrate-binding protein
MRLTFTRRRAVLAALSVAALSAIPLARLTAREPVEQELLNVSYDPTRELYRQINEAFIPHYKREAGVNLTIKQSHGGSSAQARAIIDGLDADVATLATWTDTQAIHEQGLIASGWEARLPNNSLPYTSTIVFVVRQGNPKGIKDWPDLVKPGIEVITPNPKTSANGKLSLLAAWGSVVERGGSEADALKFVKQLYSQVPVLDTGARGSTTTFAQKGIGDVHLTWENEAHLEVAEAGGELEIVVPKISILAEPFVAVVDANVDRKGTRAAAEAYLKFLYTPEAQEIIARNFYRPSDKAVQKKHARSFPKLKLFAITDISQGWADAVERFFDEGAVFDQLYAPQAQ